VIVAAATWADVALALVPTIAAVAAACIAYLNHRQIRTPSGTTIGRQVEGSHHVSLANNYRLQRLTGELTDSETPEAVSEEAQAEPPDGDALKKVIPPSG
jgi:hypothetical protein